MAIDEDDFDDDLDDLPANTLQQLEADALRSTQQQRAHPPTLHRPFKPPSRIAPLKPSISRPTARLPPHSDSADPSGSDYGFDDEDVIDLDATSHLKPQAQSVQTRWGHTTSIEQYRQSQSQRSYTYEVASRISQTKPGYVTSASLAAQRLPPQHGATAYGKPKQLYPQRIVSDNAAATQRGQSPPLSQMRPGVGNSAVESEESKTQPITAVEPPQEIADIPSISVSDLQARLEELERQNRSLHTSLSEAQTTLQAKAGEAAILRSKNEKSKVEYEQRIQAIQEKNAELLAKQKAELEATRRERERAETNNRFLENDLVLEAEKVRQAKRTLRDATGNGRKLQAAGSPFGTPKKQKNLVSHGDGFDDDVVMLSPSKYQERKKGGTPKHGTKRKRLGAEKAQNSPELALQLETVASPPAEIPLPQKAEADPKLIEKFERHKETFQLLQNLLNYRSYKYNERTLEALSRFAFPSAPGKSLSSIVYDQLGSMPKNQAEEETFPQGICTLFVRLWEKCIVENFYDPLFLIVDTIQYVLDVSPLSLSIALTTAILPHAIATVDLVAIPIAEATIAATKRLPAGRHISVPSNPASHQTSSSLSAGPKLDTRIPTDETLLLVHSLALAAKMSDDTDAIQSFWRNMQPDFLLVMLNKGQPLQQILLSLRLLQTSVLESSFGSITSKDDQTGQHQSRTEIGLLDRLILLLFEKPIPLSTSIEQLPAQQYSLDDIAHLRVEVLRVFLFMSATMHGTAAMASHSMFLGRLVKFLSASIADLYSRPPPLSALSHFSNLTLSHTFSRHALPRHPIPAINLSMRILAHILLSTPDIRLSNKLAVIPGGAHKYMVSLTRLAFAETGFVIESGIEEEVIEVAHRLLEEWVSPEEGEQLVRAHSSAPTGKEKGTADDSAAADDVS